MNIKERIQELLDKNKKLRSQVEDNTVQARTLLTKEDAVKDDLDKAKKLRSKSKELEGEIRSNEETIAMLKELTGGSRSNGDDGNDGVNERTALNTYLHTRDAASAGLKTTDAAVTIPESIVYNPENEVKTVTDLSQLVTQFTATTASGKYPILKKATSALHTVEELAKNPDLAKPEFEEVDWKVDTYRGAIPLSQESIDDSAVDLVGIVAKNANEQKINTTNTAISTVLKSFTAKEAKTLDDLKKILNVDLDPAYGRAIVCSQSFYQWLDTLKDGNGQYLLHAPITESSPSTLLGVNVYVVEDTLLGASGEMHAFVGDLARAVLYANRKDIQVRWVDNEIYGQYLQVVTRFGTKKADKNAGYFVTVNALK